jgi:hypothetical protein
MAGADMMALDKGFQTPTPRQIVDIDLRAGPRINGHGRAWARVSAPCCAGSSAKIAERVVGIPAVPVAAKVSR